MTTKASSKKFNLDFQNGQRPLVTYHGVRNPINKKLKCRGSRCNKTDWHLAITIKKNK